VAGEAARRRHRGGGGRLDAGGGRDLRLAAGASAGAAVPGRPVRVVAARHVRRVRGLARGGGAGRRPRLRRGGAAMVSAVVRGMGTAMPAAVSQQELWDGFFADHYAGTGQVLARRIFANSGVVTRHGVANPLVEDVSGWSTSR